MLEAVGYVHDLNKHHLLSFFGGAISPFLIKYSSKKINSNSILSIQYFYYV
jgi:hypothetical protein